MTSPERATSGRHVTAGNGCRLRRENDPLLKIQQAEGRRGLAPFLNLEWRHEDSPLLERERRSGSGSGLERYGRRHHDLLLKREGRSGIWPLLKLGRWRRLDPPPGA